MKEYAWIFLLVSIIAGINTVWIGFWALMGASSTLGAQLSKKVGTDNANTDRNIGIGKAFTSEMFRKMGIRAAVGIIAYILYWVFTF